MDGWEKVGSDKSVWEVKDGAIMRLGSGFDGRMHQGPVQELPLSG